MWTVEIFYSSSSIRNSLSSIFEREFRGQFPAFRGQWNFFSLFFPLPLKCADLFMSSFVHGVSTLSMTSVEAFALSVFFWRFQTERRKLRCNIDRLAASGLLATAVIDDLFNPLFRPLELRDDHRFVDGTPAPPLGNRMGIDDLPPL